MKNVRELKEGDIFGKWKVLNTFRNLKDRQIMCNTQCICGNRGIVGSSALRVGKSKGCHPCSLLELSEKRRKNFPKVGTMFGSWKVLNIIIPNKGKSKAIIKCKCGVIKETGISNLKSSNMCKNCKGLKYKGIPLQRCRKGIGDLSGNYMNALKSGAKARKFEFSITKEEVWKLFLEQEKKCALSGLEIKLGYKAIDGEQTASLDRIDNFKGYISGNVQWVHKDINNMKHKHSQEYFIKLCMAVANNNID